MLYWKYSPNRVFFLNEYWIFIPPVLLSNYVIIRKIHSYKENIRLLKKLKDQIEREKKIRRIVFLSLGLNGCAYILTRGGENVINVDYIQCELKKGLPQMNSYLQGNQ